MGVETIVYDLLKKPESNFCFFVYFPQTNNFSSSFFLKNMQIKFRLSSSF